MSRSGRAKSSAPLQPQSTYAVWQSHAVCGARKHLEKEHPIQYSLSRLTMQQQNLEIASPLAEAVYVSKVENKSAHAVSYSTDIAAGWSTDVKSSEKNGKASVAGSLYLTASDSGSQSGEDSVYDAVSLPDSDKDFEAEAGASRTTNQLAVIIRVTLC